MSSARYVVVVNTAADDFLDDADLQALVAQENQVPEPLETELLSKSLVITNPDKDWKQKAAHYIRRYPRSTTLLLCLALLFLGYAAHVHTRPPLERHKLTRHNNWDGDGDGIVPVEYKCLFGNTDASCNCEDFTEPISREEHDGWLEVHEANKKRIKVNEFGIAQYEMVFFGDDLVENLNGERYGDTIPQSSMINKFYRAMFTYDNEDSNINSVALGIAGDSTANLLWRLENGELPDYFNANVFWLMIGMADLARGHCSEEATVRGILEVAQTLHKRFPQAVIVIQGILPQSSHEDGSLEPRPIRTRLFGKAHSDKYKADMAVYANGLWPSIQSINNELASFCKHHESFVYFDASALFLEAIYDPREGKRYKLIKKLMPDYMHPSADGWNLLGNAIKKEYNRIILDEDRENLIETKEDGN